MTGAKKEIAFVLAVVGICWSLKHSVSGGRGGTVLFWVVLLLPIGLNVGGWWLWPGTWRDENSARWRKVVGALGLTINTLAACLGWGSFFYNVFLTGFDMNHAPRLPGFKEIDLYPVSMVCLILSVMALGCGIVAPRRIRLTVALGGFAMGWLILLVIGHAGVL